MVVAAIVSNTVQISFILILLPRMMMNPYSFVWLYKYHGKVPRISSFKSERYTNIFFLKHLRIMVNIGYFVNYSFINDYG